MCYLLFARMSIVSNNKCSKFLANIKIPRPKKAKVATADLRLLLLAKVVVDGCGARCADNRGELLECRLLDFAHTLEVSE